MPHISKHRRAGRPRCQVSPERIKALRSQGLSYRAIAQKLGLGYGTVRRLYLSLALVADPGEIATWVIPEGAGSGEDSYLGDHGATTVP